MSKQPIFAFKLHVPVFKFSLRRLISGIFLILFVTGMALSFYLIQEREQLNEETQLTSQAFESEKQDLDTQLASLTAQLDGYLMRDEYQINQELEKEINAINTTYQLAVATYEKLLEAKDIGIQKDQLDSEFAKGLIDLSERNYASAEAKLNFVNNETIKEIKALAEKQAQELAQEQATAQVATSNTPPGSGYSRQAVQTDIGTFTVDIVAGDLGSTKIIVDTASESDCANECPVLSLGEYVARNGAFAGINGSYFCPASYPSCVGKSNSFDTLLMNKNKTYFNSDNNVYSTVPAVIFGSGWVRFVSQSLEWGRDTGIDSMIANQPLLVSGGTVVFGGDGDPKKGSKSNRSFVASKGNTVYIGVVRNATVAESARAMKGLGMEYALNLDAGGSTALWSGGYKAGPGRNLPNAILFVSK